VLTSWCFAHAKGGEQKETLQNPERKNACATVEMQSRPGVDKLVLHSY